MAATPQNVEMEAAKFLHKLIQESTDEPTKLATKLYVILQHMRSSGKENSMPYQVISRAMETVINRHGLDIEALMSSRQPLTSGTQGGDSSLSQIAGPSQQSVAENDSNKPLTTEDPTKIAAFSSKPLHGSISAGHDIYQGSATHHNSIKSHGSNAGFSGSYESAEPGNSMSMQFTNSYDNQSAATLMHKGPAGKALEHEGGFSNVMANASKPVQGISNNVAEMGMHRNEASRDTGKLPAMQASSAGPSMPFKEHHLKQLRAQCLVFLAFRNNLMPKKLHLEIALGNFFPKEDISSKDIDQKGKEQSIGGQSISHEVGMPSTRLDSSSGSGFISETNLLKEGEKLDRIMDKTGPLSEHGEGMRNNIIPRKMEPEMQVLEARESQTSGTKVAQPDPTNSAPHAGLFAVPVGESKSHADNQGSQHGHHNTLPSLPLRERHLVPKNANVLEKDVMIGNNLGGEETSELDTSPASPKYTTSEKWIADCQKRKVAADHNWAVKKKKTEQRISACVEKLKETVSSSEDISAKTRSVIELKKLELLDLQRRLRNDILNDFFRPISIEMDRLKSIKKHRIGRRSKQLERYEQKMKEERQKRIRERQKDFFGEMELHRERLEDVFKYRRERVKGFNKYVREFHKRKERLHREKIDRIQREKINLLKINDVEGYLRMVQDAKSDRVKQLLKETEKYLQKLGSKLKEAKVINRCFETDMNGLNDSSEFTIENEDETDQAKHYMESNEKYYMMAHSIKETVAEQPASLIGGKLREYQMNGLRWLLSLYNNHLNGILADEMGLGKTVQVISLLCYLMENKNDRGPFLVVVPSSVLPGWESEINFWAPSINKIVYSGPPEERRRLFKERIVQQKFNVLLTTYEYLMNKHDRPKLSKIHWHYVIIDEGHRIKNASCKLNADLKHYHSSHRLLLTGTPLQNNLEELWALLNFLLPNIFNSSEDFSQWFNKPFESNADNSLEEALLSEEENLLIINRLHQVLRPFVLRRLKHKVENQLPEKIERLVRCEASAYQKLLMQRVEENLGAFGALKTKAVHNSVVELRNICNHPYLSQLHTEEVHEFVPKHYLPNVIRFCGKLEMLDRLLPKLKATDHRVLLFSTMTRLLDVMEDYLYWKQYRYLRLDGHTSGGDRGALIDQFNSPGSPFFIFLLSIRAGGVGVNLQAADTVIIFDTDWNPQVDLQAQARAHRIGQKKDVLVLRLETVQTVEEQVRASAEHKLGVANQSITAGFFDNNTSAEDRREYLEALLRECKKEEAAPVLNDDALNDLIARSESEIDVFEELDKKRQEEELIEWKKLLLEQGGISGEVIPPLPSRLVTDDDLKSFCEAMKAVEVPKPLVVPGIGGKRKGELGNFDTQQYGRGKRAREVRSYEEQWTEDEFEKLCQVEAPGSPNTKEELKERDLSVVKIESGMVIAAEGTGLPKMQQMQSSEDLPIQQIKEVNPPSKRGRGRPKKQKTGIFPSPMVLPASPVPASSTAKSDASTVHPLGTTITSPSGSKSNPSDGGQSPASMVSATKATMAVPPGFQPTANHPPGFQPTATPPGYKSLTTPPGYQSLTTPPGYQQTAPPPPGFQPKVTSPTPQSGSQGTTSLASGPLSTSTIPADPQATSTANSLPDPNMPSAAHSNTNLSPGTNLTPALPLGSVSLPMLPPSSPDLSAISPIAVTPGRGRGRGRGRPRGRGRGRGQVVESEVTVPQRRGRKTNNVVLAIPGLRATSPVSRPETVSLSTTVSETGNKASVSNTISTDVVSKTVAPVAGGTPVTVSPSETSKMDIASPKASVPATSVSVSSIVTDSTNTPLDPDVGTTQDPDVGTAQTPVSVSVATVPLASHPVSRSTSVLKQGRGRGRKAQSGSETPRRRERKKEDTVDAQVQKSNEPAQKKQRASSGRKTVATRSMYRSEAQKTIDTTSEPLLNSSASVKEQSSTLADGDILNKSADKSTLDGNISTNGEEVVEPNDTSVATKSRSMIDDAVDNIDPKEELDPKKVITFEAEKESKPSKEVEKSSPDGDILPLKVEVLKSETEHEEQATECKFSEEAGARVDNGPQVVAENVLSVQKKTEGKYPKINDGDTLVAMEASPVEQDDGNVHGATEILPEVAPVEKDAIQTVQKSEIEKTRITGGDSLLEIEAPSAKKSEELSQREHEREKQEEANDPIEEHMDDTDKTSSDPAITQGERDDLAIIEGSKAVERDAKSSNVVVDAKSSDVVVDAFQGETGSGKMDTDLRPSETVEDASQGESEHEKQELGKSDASSDGIKENVTDERTAVASPVISEGREDDQTVDGGTLVEMDDKSSKKDDFLQGETELQKSELGGELGIDSYEKDIREDKQSTKELCSAEEVSIDGVMLEETEARLSEKDNDDVQGETIVEAEQKTEAIVQDERCNLDPSTGIVDNAEAKPSEGMNEAMQMETDCENQKERGADALDTITEDVVHVGQGEGRNPEVINTESQENMLTKSSNENFSPLEGKNGNDENDHESPMETGEITKELHVEEIVNQAEEGSTCGLNEGSKQGVSTDVGQLDEINHPVTNAEHSAEHNDERLSTGADELSVEECQKEATSVTFEEHDLVADISGGGINKHSSEVEEQKVEKMEITEDKLHGEDDKHSSEVEEQKIEKMELTDAVMCGEDDKHFSEDEEQKLENMEITEAVRRGEDDKHSSEVEELKVEKMEITEDISRGDAGGCSVEEYGNDVIPTAEKQEISTESSMEEREPISSKTGIYDFKLAEQVAGEQEVVERSVEERESNPSITETDDLKMQKPAGDKHEHEVALESSMEENEADTSKTRVNDSKMEEVVAAESSMEKTESKPAETGSGDSIMEVEGGSEKQEIIVESSMVERETKTSKPGADDSTIQEQEVSAEGEAKPFKTGANASTSEEQEVAAERSIEERESKPAETRAGDSMMEEQVATKNEQIVIAENSVEEREAKPIEPRADDFTMHEQEVAAESSMEETETEPSTEVITDSTVKQEREMEPFTTAVAYSTVKDQVVGEKEEQEVAAESSMEEREREPSTTVTADSTVKEHEVQKEEVAAESSMEERDTEPSTTVTADSTVKEHEVQKEEVAAESSMKERETEPSTTVTAGSTVKEVVVEKEERVATESSMDERETESCTTVAADSTVKEVSEKAGESSIEEREMETSTTVAADLTVKEKEVVEKEQVAAESSMQERETKPSATVTVDSTAIEQVVSKKEEQEVAPEISMEEREAEPSTTRADDLTFKNPVVGEKEQELTADEERELEPFITKTDDSTMKEEPTAESSMEVRESEPSKTEVDDSAMKQVADTEQEQVVAESGVMESKSEPSKPEADDSKGIDQSAENEHKQEVAVGSSMDERETAPLKTVVDDPSDNKQVADMDHDLGTEISSSGNDDE